MKPQTNVQTFVPSPLCSFPALRAQASSLLFGALLICEAFLPHDVHATTITIEPDNYPVGTVLTSISPFVTLWTTSFDNVSEPTFAVSANSVPSGAPTGSEVFAAGGVAFWETGQRLRMDFHASVSTISIDFAGSSAFDTEVGRLDLYDAVGDLIAEDDTSPLAKGETEVMSLSGDFIPGDYAIAYTAVGNFGKLDFLQLIIPEPSAAALLAVAGLALAGLNRSLNRRGAERAED